MVGNQIRELEWSILVDDMDAMSGRLLTPVDVESPSKNREEPLDAASGKSADSTGSERDATLASRRTLPLIKKFEVW